MKRGGYLQRRTRLQSRTPFTLRTRPKVKRRARSAGPTLAQLKKRLWELCKAITRNTYGNVCYTCGAQDLAGSNWHTGHFITDSTCSTELSYDLENLRPQCYRCNIHLSGNWVAFEAHLLMDKGPEWITNLKARNRATMGLRYDHIWFANQIARYEAILHDGTQS